MAKRAKSSKTNGSAPTGAWWDQAVEVPRAGLPDAAKLAKRAQRLRRLVWASLVLLPAALFVIFLLGASLLGSEATDDVVVNADTYADTKPTAIVAVREWLASDPAPLPGGVLVGWHSATSDTQEPSANSTDPATTLQAHRLTVADSAGNLYDTYVALGILGDGEPSVIDTPNLMPRVPGGDAWSGPTWPGLDEQASTEEMRAAVTAWAAAYSSGDPAALRLAVGDDNASRNYMPLTGAVLGEPRITTVAGIWGGDVDPADRGDNAETVVARVQFDITWPTQASEEEPTSNTSATVTYDLLLKKANTAAPAVVAWGGSGTGPDLKPYGNAVSSVVTIAPPATDGSGTDLGVDEAAAPVSDAATTKKTKKGKNQ